MDYGFEDVPDKAGGHTGGKLYGGAIVDGEYVSISYELEGNREFNEINAMEAVAANYREAAGYYELAAETVKDFIADVIEVAIYEVVFFGIPYVVKGVAYGIKYLKNPITKSWLKSVCESFIQSSIRVLKSERGHLDISKLRGRWGSFKHRMKIAEVAAELIKEGASEIRYWGAKGGEKLLKSSRMLKNRFPDITAIVNGKTIYVQVGRVYKQGRLRGLPIKREMEALLDIYQGAQSGAEIRFYHWE